MNESWFRIATKDEMEKLHIRRVFLQLRSDAIARGLSEVAIAYGWSIIRIGEEVLARDR